MPSARDIAFIGCRLLALCFLYFALVNLPQSFYALSSFSSRQWQGENIFYQAGAWLSFAVPIVSLAIVLLLWHGARWISREVADGAPAETSAWSPQSLLSVGVVLLGLTLASFALPQIVITALYIADSDQRVDSYQISNLAAAVLRFLVGLWFILGTRRIVAFLAGLRRWSAERG